MYHYKTMFIYGFFVFGRCVEDPLLSFSNVILVDCDFCMMVWWVKYIEKLHNKHNFNLLYRQYIHISNKTRRPHTKHFVVYIF